MRTILSATILLLLSIKVLGHDITFESSDGCWKDSTFEKKGRSFQTILWGFEAYKLKENRPDVTLVRITKGPPPVSSGAKKNADRKNNAVGWKVPYAAASGHATIYIYAYKPEEIVEIDRRAKTAYEYWERQSSSGPDS